MGPDGVTFNDSRCSLRTTPQGSRDKKDIKKQRDAEDRREIKEKSVERTKDSRDTVFGNKDGERRDRKTKDTREVLFLPGRE